MKITEFNTGDIIVMTDEKKVAEQPELFRYALELRYIENDEIHLALYLNGTPHPIFLEAKTHMEGWEIATAHTVFWETNIKTQLQKAQERFFNNVEKQLAEAKKPNTNANTLPIQNVIDGSIIDRDVTYNGKDYKVYNVSLMLAPDEQGVFETIYYQELKDN